MLLLADRLSGGLIGMLIGDAMGVPYEFCRSSALPVLSELSFSPPHGFRRSHSSVPPGTWSDDGAQALALLASLLECDRLDLLDFSQKLQNWYHRGAFAPDRAIFDCGIQTRVAIRALDLGVAPERAGPSDEQSNGNGSLMRVLPLALWHSGSDAELVADARLQSLVTHGQLCSQLCCAFYVKGAFTRSEDAWAAASRKLLALVCQDAAARKELEFILRESHRDSACGSGYVLNSLWSARIALHELDFVSVVRAAIAFGNDTDTTACIAAGLAGVRDGLAAIPEHWRISLRGHGIVEPLLQKLLVDAGCQPPNARST
jgi:ADP-ribosyl-[dinitrogen reductase] hydrolase